jgi:hypothetical protein
MKLNQVIAIEKGVKNKTHAGITEVYQKLQKPDLVMGVSRKYTPIDDDGEKFPSERKLVQVTVINALKTVQTQLAELFDVTATKDWANCAATAPVVIDGTVLLEKVPVTYLLFLEKQLVNIYTLVSKLPTLDPAEEWHFDTSSAVYASSPSGTNKTKKVPKAFVKAVATDKHPAQVEMFTEDVVVGSWETIKFSGAIPTTMQQQILERVEKIQRAVKFAREEANSVPVTDVKLGEKVMKFIFG